MAFPMGLTALALLWLLWRLTGGTGLVIGLAGSMVLIGALMLRKRSAPLPLLASAAVFALLVISGGWALPETIDAPKKSATRLIAAQPFSEAGLATLRQQRRPVFLYFTADWCITCKINEATAIQTEATAKAFKSANIVMMEADFTRNDPAIAGFLTRHGRSGVPLYLYYAPGEQGTILPQLLTADFLVKLGKNM